MSDKRELERWGAERIRRGLSARGIDRAIAEQTLAATPDAVDLANLDSPRAEHCDGRGGELARALELLRRRFPDPPQERRDRNRALGMLLRKGYEQELAIDALNAHAARGLGARPPARPHGRPRRVARRVSRRVGGP